jgi:hypothetical protein
MRPGPVPSDLVVIPAPAPSLWEDRQWSFRSLKIPGGTVMRIPLLSESTPAEKRILKSFPTGEVVELPTVDSRRTVRAAVIRDLLLKTDLPLGAGAALRVIGAKITGRLDLEGVIIKVPIFLSKCVFDEPPCFSDAELFTLRLPGCVLPGLSAPGLRTKSDVELNGGFTCSGKVDLLGAQVGGLLRLSDATILNPGKEALVMSRASVASGLLAGGLHVDGQLRMISARIGGLLSLRHAVLSNPGQIALQAERLEVGESIFFQHDFTAEGRVVLQNSTIGGGVDAESANFNAPGMTCLNMIRSNVGRNIGLSGAKFKGNVRLNGATVAGRVSFVNTEFVPEQNAELSLDNVRVPTVRLRYDVAPYSLTLRHAHFEVMEDDPQAWPDKLSLTGCSYSTLDSATETTVAQRLSWLARSDDGYRPQPYEQLIAAYRANGEEQQARRVALEKQRLRRRTLSWPGRVLGLALEFTVGYGYRVWLAAVWLLAFLVAGTVTFTIWPAQPTGTGHIPAFQPFVFSLDLLLPIVNLGQADNWQAEGAVRWFAWGLILAGWGLTTAVAAGITRVLNRT